MILFPIISSWMAIEARRRLFPVFPDPVREWWDKWELRGLVFTSLVSQVVLTLLGNRRKYGTNKVTESIVWIAYLLADKVPSVALGVISSKLGDYYDKNGEQIQNPQLMAFWAPFFLVHIGGHDTITAFSLEDNELWFRHSVGLVAQTLLTLYIILLSWNGTSWFSYLSVPILILGFIKYGERTWSLYSASINYCRDSWLSSADSETKELSHQEILQGFLWLKGFMSSFVSFFSDMVLGTKDIEALKQMFRSLGYKEAFVRIDFYHGFWYDIMYTKAPVTHTILGCVARLITSFSLVVLFILNIIFSDEHEKHLEVDRIITYMLLVAAAISEIFSIISLVLYSEWTLDILRFCSYDHGSWSFLPVLIRWLEKRTLRKTSLWWNSMAQCNFFTLLCLENKKFKIDGDSFSAVSKLEKLPKTVRCPFSLDLKKMLYDNVVNKSLESTPFQTQPGPRYRELVKAQKLRRRRLIIQNLEFHQSILLWHIVTDVCYYCDDNRDVPENAVNSRESKIMSDYMFYLLVKRRHMLPIGTGLLSLLDTLFEIITYCHQQKSLTLTSDVGEACKTLVQCLTEDAEYTAALPIGRSVFRYAFLTVHELLARQDRKQIWEFLTELSIEIMSYGAARCRVDRHAQEISNGGEFLSCVWGLHAVAGLLDQFQLTKAEGVYEDESDV